MLGLPGKKQFHNAITTFKRSGMHTCFQRRSEILLSLALVCNWFELSKIKIGKMHEENLTC